MPGTLYAVMSGFCSQPSSVHNLLGSSPDGEITASHHVTWTCTAACALKEHARSTSCRRDLPMYNYWCIKGVTFGYGWVTIVDKQVESCLLGRCCVNVFNLQTWTLERAGGGEIWICSACG